jgi:Mrp family chromosome partitioning ATPase
MQDDEPGRGSHDSGPVAIPELLTRFCEQIMLAANTAGVRIIGIASAEAGAGVSLIARGLAETYARAGMRTLLLDLSRSGGGPATWAPSRSAAAEAVERDAVGFDRITGSAAPTTRPLFNNLALLRQAYADELSEYGTIVVDLPPVLHDGADLINGAAAALACDGVVLVCPTGRMSRTRLAQASGALRGAHVKLLGTVLNEQHAPTLGREIAREAARLQRISPRLARWIGRQALASEFLN